MRLQHVIIIVIAIVIVIVIVTVIAIVIVIVIVIAITSYAGAIYKGLFTDSVSKFWGYPVRQEALIKSRRI